MLSLISHKHVLKLIDYCADDIQNILVYEYMQLESDNRII